VKVEYFKIESLCPDFELALSPVQNQYCFVFFKIFINVQNLESRAFSKFSSFYEFEYGAHKSKIETFFFFGTKSEQVF
jgi:hypothetical protein